MGERATSNCIIVLYIRLIPRIDPEGPICNPTVKLLGHIALDLAQPRVALQTYQEPLAARLERSDLKCTVIPDVYDSITCAYTEIGIVSEAFAYLEEAKAIHLTSDQNPCLESLPFMRWYISELANPTKSRRLHDSAGFSKN